MKTKFSLHNKVVVLTGGGSGIGKAMATTFAAQGAEVHILDFNLDAANDTVAVIIKAGFKAKTHHCNVADYKQVNKIISKIAVSSSIDILINNAGITGSTSSLWDYDVDEWNKIININLMGTFNCCKCIVPNMIKNDYGRIVNVASVAGKDGNANASAYSSAKAGVIGLTKSLGKELADKNIAVNAVTPAGAKTRILDQMSKEHVARMLSKVPRGRFLEIEEFTSVICWLASEENSFSTAAVFDISGGRSTY